MFIKDMLDEELQNSLQMKKEYERALKQLPRGSLVRKDVGGRSYFYLAHREGGRVEFDYLGKIPDEDVRLYEDAKKSRARYRERLREVNEQIRFLQKVLREKRAI